MEQALKIFWSRLALGDLDRFVEFLEPTSPRLAQIIPAELVKRVDLVSKNPHVGRALDETGAFRQVVVQVLGAAYVIRYEVAADAVIILRVFHGREHREP